MEVHLTPAQETALTKLAADTGRRADELVQEAVDRLLAYNQWFKEQVQVGLDQIARGEVVSHEEVGERIERLFRA
jgi:predicted transcriptional regulator